MDVRENGTVGSLHIATEVLGKIAAAAALEVEGVAAVRGASNGVRRAVTSRIQKPVTVTLTDGVAGIDINIVVRYGVRIPAVCARVQEDVKAAVQNMTGVTVLRVNVIVAGIVPQEA